jgi:hypothetical protein
MGQGQQVPRGGVSTEQGVFLQNILYIGVM